MKRVALKMKAAEMKRIKQWVLTQYPHTRFCFSSYCEDIHQCCESSFCLLLVEYQLCQMTFSSSLDQLFLWEISEFPSTVQVCISDRHRPRKKQRVTKKGKGRDWVLKKKEQMRKKGNHVPPDTKYTARKRKARFWFLQESDIQSSLLIPKLAHTRWNRLFPPVILCRWFWPRLNESC